MPFFSIISPVYNTAPYLAQFLDSVLSQSFRDFELILVDDGSTDGSAEICMRRQQEDSRIQIYTQKNAGAGAARNKGIEVCTGQFLLFFDSDDWILPDCLQLLHDEMCAAPTDLLIYGSTEFFYNKEEKYFKKEESVPESVSLETAKACRMEFCKLLFTSVINVPWNKVFRADLIRKNEIRFPNVRRAQDAFFNMEYYKHIECLRTIQAPLYCYRSNTAAKIWKKFPKDLYKIDIRYDAYLVDIFKQFEIYEGEGRKKVDELFFNSVFRTVGFYRNPVWHLSRKEKEDYVKEILSNEYNQQRAQDALALDPHTQTVRSLILSADEKAMIRYFKKVQSRTKLYDIYAKTLRKLIKKK